MNLDTDAHPQLKKELAGFAEIPGSFLVRIEGRFESSHYLYAYMANGSDEPMHGHSWLVQISLASLAHRNTSIQKNGVSFDFLAVRQRLNKLLERIEHLCINDLEEFQGVNPTAENIARWFYQGLKRTVAEKEGKILEVRVYEGPGNMAVFCPV